MDTILHTRRGGMPNRLRSAMFAARKEVFVDLLGWDVPVIGGRFEVDQFDDANAQYIVLADPNGAHVGSARLLPTLGPHILGDLFPWLCDASPPRDPQIFEITRFCLSKGLPRPARRAVRDQLVSAIVADALATDIKAYTAIADLSWARQILAFGWRCSTLGAPQLHEGRRIMALRIEVDEATPGLLAAGGLLVSGKTAVRNLRLAA